MRNRSSIILKFVFVCLALSGMVVGQDSKTSSGPNQSRMPTLFIIGDSTVNNSEEGMKGWGNVVSDYFDRTKINVVNRARGGRSSRTFYTEGLWDQVAAEIKPGDFVLMQFGHNDGGPIDKEKFRGSLKGIGEETQEITVEATGKKEAVHTYGWYMNKFISDAKTKGATAIVLSPVPRNIWKDGRVVRAVDDYGKWAAESAKIGGAVFVDLNEIVARRYEKDGEDKVDSQYFTIKDHTHTSPAGARVNAESVIEGLRSLKNDPLKKYLLKEKK